MIVLGDISGIQNYVFDVADEGGRQARRLRARSFFVQLLAEAASLRLCIVLGWQLDSILFSAAGKFLLEGPHHLDAERRLDSEVRAINEWLLEEARGELRLSMSWSRVSENSAGYAAAQRDLQIAKARPWAPENGFPWEPSALILTPLDSPCRLCGHAPAREEEIDRETGENRSICTSCALHGRLGQILPRAAWLAFQRSDGQAAAGTGANVLFNALGLNILISGGAKIPLDSGTLALANLREPNVRPQWCPPDRFLVRRLNAYVPARQDGTPIWFTELAREARGDRLLGVLKADVDSLGVRFQRLVDKAGIQGLRLLSDQLDEFFAGRLQRELTRDGDRRWGTIYTIFAGGDDLAMVGPWDTVVDFAGQVRAWFREAFPDTTLSAGIALIKPKRPIKFAVAEAERLLELAKEGTKDQLAAFGQVWAWKDHQRIMETAQQLVSWVDAGDIQRGWLHTILELANQRNAEAKEPLATARLAYHLSRNWHSRRARPWVQRLVQHFEDSDDCDSCYLPAITRYALTATRTRGEEE